jgi:hypothetical protein
MRRNEQTPCQYLLFGGSQVDLAAFNQCSVDEIA